MAEKIASVGGFNGNSGGAHVGLLINRLTHSAGEDRLQTLEELAKVTRNNFARVGRVGVPVLVDVLQEERNEQVVIAVLDALTTLVCVGQTAAESMKMSAKEHASKLLESKTVVEKILVLLKQDRFWLRVKAVQLLSSLASVLPDRVGQTVQGVEAGMLRLVEVLNDKREEVRNELLQLLRRLTAISEEIQQFCAFSQVFPQLLEIMIDEGLVDGGAIVKDCLSILENCVSRNAVVRKMFLEPGKCLRGILPILRRKEARASNDVRLQDYDTLSRATHTKKVGDGRSDRFSPPEPMRIVLRIVRSLVSPVASNSRNKLDEATRRELARREDQQLKQNQQALIKLGYLEALSLVALDYNYDEVPDGVRVLSLDTLGHVLRGNARSLASLGEVVVTTRAGSVAVPATVSLMRNVLESNLTGTAASCPRGLSLRDAATRAFCRAVSSEDAASTWIGHTMSPSPQMLGSGSSSSTVMSAATTGKLLVDRMLESGSKVVTAVAASAKLEALWSHWRCARLLEYVLRSGGETTRMLALRITVGGDASTPQKFLLHRCLRLLVMSCGQRKGGSRSSGAADVDAILSSLQCSILRLVCIWLWSTPRAVDEVVVRPGNLFLYDFAKSNADRLVGQWCSLLIGSLVMFGSESCAVTPRHVLKTITNRVGLDAYTDALLSMQVSPLLASAARVSKRITRFSTEDPDPLFATRAEMLGGVPPSIDHTVAHFARDALSRIPRRMIELYAIPLSKNAPPDDDPSACTVSLLKSVIAMEERLRQSSSEGSSVDATKEPEVVRIVAEVERLTRLSSETRAKAASDARDFATKRLNYEQEIEQLRRSNKKLEDRVAEFEHADVMTGSTPSKSGHVVDEAGGVTKVTEGDRSHGFVAMAGAMEQFAELETLRSKVARLSQRLSVKEAEEGRAKQELESMRSEIKSKSAALETLRSLEDEHVDLLSLLAQVEAERLSLGDALEKVGGADARADAEKIAREAILASSDEVAHKSTSRESSLSKELDGAAGDII